ncbi:MAG: hypothetical protein JXB05_20150 [Myxococcaceae bacterium]|nr:hypothetical protein [Myxococcaceae bacterium]
MRSLLLLVCLVSAAAGAQPLGRFSAQAEPPDSSSSPDEPDWARTPPAEGPAEPAGVRARRYSRFSAGPGGPSLVVLEVIIGLAGGAMVGSSFDAEGETNHFYTGAMLGGLTLGTAGTLYQYFLPVERRESLLTAFAAVAGLSAGIGFANNQDLPDRDRAIIALMSSQLGVFSSLLLTSGDLELSGSDLGLISIMPIYTTLFAGFIELINDAQSTRGYNYAPMLIAPAVGMAIGGLLSIPLELNGLGFALITAIPLSITGMTFGFAVAISRGLSAGAARAGLISLSASLVITALTTALTYVPPPQERASASAVRITPMPVLLAAGRDHSGLAAGPGLWIQF